MLSLPAGGEPGPQHSNADGTIGFQDLHGSTVVAGVTHEQRIRREGREYTAIYEREWKLIIGPDETLQITFTPTSHAPRRMRGETTTSVVKLGELRQVRGAGGPGQAIWSFRDGALVFLRTYKVGAGRMTIEFSRGGDGLACTANFVLAYEDAKPFISLETIDGKPAFLVGDKKLSAHCRVFI